MNAILAVSSAYFATISGGALVNAVIWLIVAAVIFWLLTWLVSYIGIGEPFAKIIKVVLAILAVLICVNALLSLTGHPIVAWP